VDNHDKSFAPCTAGLVFGVHYDMLAWTWAIPDEKLARMCMLPEEAIAAKQIRSLVGKLVHVKPLVPAGRFNMNKIMRVYRAAARTQEHVAITSVCTGSSDSGTCSSESALAGWTYPVRRGG
jgi:hypothetical protein